MTAAAAAVLASPCAVDLAAAAPGDEPAAIVVGDASTIESGVEVRNGSVAPYAALTDTPVAVAVGDGVRTDETGYAEVAYLDGSRTRLDVETEFTVLQLVDETGTSSTRTEMRLGRTWHRVESLGEGEFTVETSQATATVLGTAFATACASAAACTYLLVSGVLELTLRDGTVVLLVGPTQVEVVRGIAGPVVALSAPDVLGDDWLSDNIERDTAAGFSDLRTILEGGPATFGPDDPAALPMPAPITLPPTTTAGATTTTTASESSTTEPSGTVPTTGPTGPTAPTGPTTTASPTATTSPAVSTTPNATTTSTTPTATTTTTPPPSTSTTTAPTSSTTTTTEPPLGRIAICHAVEGEGNTGNGYNYLVVDAAAAERHAEHVGDLVPAPNRSCSLET